MSRLQGQESGLRNMEECARRVGWNLGKGLEGVSHTVMEEVRNVLCIG